MTAITASMVKELREATGLGMMECKKALVEANGDFKVAEEQMRIKSGAKASKASSRVTAEGVVGAFISVDGKSGAVVEVNCETDFVAKNDDFVAFAKDVAETVAKSNPADLEALAGVVMGAKWAIGRKKPHDIIDLPEMEDPLKMAAMRILISTASSAFLAMPNMFPVIVFNLVKLSLKYGNSKYSTYGYATYGLILCGALGDMKSGNKYGIIALDLLKRYDATEFKAKVFFVYYAFIYQWQNPIRDTFQHFMEGYKSGLETGDFEYGGWNIFHFSTYSFFAGQPLDENVENLSEMRLQGEKLGIKQVTLLMDIWIPAFKTLNR